MNLSVSITKKTLHLKSPFQQASRLLTENDIVFVELTDEQGRTGLGSAAAHILPHETADVAYDSLQKNLTEDFFDRPLSDWYYYHEKIQNTFSRFPTACHAVEEALFNLLATQNNVSPSLFFGGYRAQCPIMYTIGIMSVDETVQVAKEKLNEGFTTIKLKIGLDVDKDVERITQVRSILPANCKLVLDANEGYTFSDAKKLISALEKLDIAILEQPVKRDALDQLKQLTSISRVPIIADESVVSIDDALHLLTNDYVHGVNIKLMKCGGPVNFIKIFNIVKSLKKIMMLGCYHESHVSITTGARVACALPIDFVDLDSGHMDYIDDPTKNGAIVTTGAITPGTLVSL